MKQRVASILVLMSVCTVCLLLFQFYWSYEAYQGTSRTYRSDVNEALQAAVDREMEHRQDEIADKYKGWLADSNLVVIQCHIDSLSGLTVFSIIDSEPSSNDRVEFTIGYRKPGETPSRMTPTAKKYLIDRFVGTQIRENLQKGNASYYTRRLGELMEETLRQNKPDKERLQRLYIHELQERGLDTDFRLHFAEEKLAASGPFPYATRTIRFGFRKPYDTLKASFPDPYQTLLLRTKWVLLVSFLLMAVTVFCFAYTVLTLLRQKKLADLKRDFVNNMTHELRTPVATISIAAEAMQAFNLSKTSSDEYLAIIRQQSGRLSQLIDGILKNLAFEQDQLELSPCPLSLQELAQQAVLQHRPQLDAAEAETEFDFPTQPLLVNADELHLLNVLSNLIENALKYSDGPLKLHLRCREESGRAVLALKDNGIGIPASVQSRVFEKFFRVPSGNTHNTKGYGLGLSYAKTIVERHGGGISLQSQERQGTTFFISLPLHQHEPAPDTVA